MPECDMDCLHCREPATSAVTIEDPSGTFEPLHRSACGAHVGWYRDTFEDQGYRVTVESIEAHA